MGDREAPKVTRKALRRKSVKRATDVYVKKLMRKDLRKVLKQKQKAHVLQAREQRLKDAGLLTPNMEQILEAERFRNL